MNAPTPSDALLDLVSVANACHPAQRKRLRAGVRALLAAIQGQARADHDSAIQAAAGSDTEGQHYAAIHYRGEASGARLFDLRTQGLLNLLEEYERIEAQHPSAAAYPARCQACEPGAAAQALHGNGHGIEDVPPPPAGLTPCPECAGHGADPLSDNAHPLPCRTCGGSGRVAQPTDGEGQA